MSLLKEREYYKPFQYPWAFENYKKQQQMHWLPDEVPLQDDIKDYNFKLLLKNNQYYIDYGDTILDVPKQNGSIVRLNQMNQFNYIVN